MEKKIKIAYLVIAYMDPEQLRRLAVRLGKSANVYVHINASVEIAPFEQALQGVEGTMFSRERYKVVWGGYSILRAAFSMLEQAMKREQYDRYVLLTGLDYPIKSDEQIQEFFRKYEHTEFVPATPVNGEMPHFDHLCYYTARDHRILNKCLQKWEKLLRACGKKGKADYVLYQGEKYVLYGVAPKWALSGECASYLLDFYKKNKKFNRYFQFMHAPDDFYVATVLFHSRFRDLIESGQDIFKIVWLPQDGGAKVLGKEDLQELRECPQLYAKKFQSGSSEELSELLDKEQI